MTTGDAAGQLHGLDLLVRADHGEPSVFRAENMLREARRQRGLPSGRVPSVCLLDPDGDVVRHLRQSRRGARSPAWACYHTELIETEVEGLRVGVVGNAVGAPFAVLVAEELFASGCDLLISVTSAGQIGDELTPPIFVLIDRALRGEGTSHRYVSPAASIDANGSLIEAAAGGLAAAGIATHRGTTWTTDAPFRETGSALAAAANAGAVAVEMEAAALYAFAELSGRPVICFAQVTNRLAQVDGDFEKGPADGAEEALRIVVATAQGWLANREEHPR